MEDPYNWVNNYMNKMKIELYRHKYTVKKDQTLGTMCILNNYETILYSCKTLELPWRENKRQLSCIPTGKYKVTKWNSPKFGACFKIHDVEGRTNILIHAGNYKRQTLGCILVGARFKDLDGDRITDITESKKTLNELLDLLPSGNIDLTIY